jgi:hypothetical protein
VGHVCVVKSSVFALPLVCLASEGFTNLTLFQARENRAGNYARSGRYARRRGADGARDCARGKSCQK